MPFSDLLSALAEQVDLAPLSADARLAFFLNLYHTLINHSYLLLGPPPSLLAWMTYFGQIAYHVGDELVSLAGLEHCVLRAGMSRPNVFLSKLALPSSSYSWGGACCALAVREPRLNFALNCGSLSNPPSVPVYRPEALDAMLDAVASQYLSERVHLLGGGDRAISLPMPFQWFAKDFGAAGRERATPAECARYAARYIEDAGTRERLLAAAESGAPVRFRPFNFRCRPLGLLADDELLIRRDAPVLN